MATTKTGVFESGYRYFSERERICEITFREAVESSGPFWHVSTPGKLTEIINVTPEDFKFSVSNMAISAFEAGVTVITDNQMENHLHGILGGSQERCETFLEAFRFREARHLASVGREVDLSRFRCDAPIPILDLDTMRREICYVNRNGYVDDFRFLPFSYPWGGGKLFFNPSSQAESGVPYNKISFKEKRALCCRRVVELPECYQVKDGMILPSSYVSYKLGESMFRDAHHYLSLLLKNVEAYCEEAKRMGDSSVLSREEMYPAVQKLCLTEYNVKQPSQLPNEAKLAVARTMHYDFKASNAQIRMILKMTDYEVNSLFPLTALHNI